MADITLHQFDVSPFCDKVRAVSREMVQNELAGGLKAWLKANGRSVRQLGIIATTEGVEEAATQISQNMTDNLYRPVELG